MIRYGGNWWVQWPVRSFLVAVVVGLGFLPYKYEIGGNCRVVATREVALRASLQDEITEVFVSDGDRVEEGALVARLSAREEGAALAEAKADVDYARANLKFLETGPREQELAKANEQISMWKSQVAYWDAEHKRQAELEKIKAASANSVEKALSSRDSAQAMLVAAEAELSQKQDGFREESIDAARAKLAKAEANLRLQEQRLPLSEVRSSIRGTVSSQAMQLRVGQTVSPGDLVAVVRDLDSLKLEIMADEAAAENVREGMEVKIRLWGNYGKLCTGHVERVDVMATNEAQFFIEAFRSDRETRQEEVRFRETRDRYLRIVVAFDEPDPKLLPGMTGAARVVVGEDYFWHALSRPIVRFFLVEAWSWLP